MSTVTQEWYTLKQVEHITGYSNRQLYRFKDKGLIHPVKQDGSVYMLSSDELRRLPRKEGWKSADKPSSELLPTTPVSTTEYDENTRQKIEKAADVLLAIGNLLEKLGINVKDINPNFQ